jgi:hypothetical protein
MEIDKAIRTFTGFLNSSWDIVYQLLLNRDYTTNESSINDWLQANWELLVERKVLKVNEYLEVYGDEADFNGDSSRITDPEALPNFRVIVKIKNDNPILDVLNNEQVRFENATFDKIVGFENGFYTIGKKFEYVLIIDPVSGLERVVAIDDVEFGLKEL